MKIIKFGAVWCSGCLVMKPRWKEIESENSWLETTYYDFDLDKEKVKEHNINENLPAFIFLDKNNKEFLRLTGEVSKEKLLEILNQNKEK
jgi:thiol-disulfide isomerase/thioredoxin